MSDTTVTVELIINNSIARAKDPKKTQWSDIQLLAFLNKAYDHIHKTLILARSEIVITESTITMVTLTQEYSLATNLADFWGMTENGVYFADVVEPLIPLTFEDKQRAENETTDTYPESYYITNLNLGVIDIPTGTSAAAHPTLNCRYYKKNTPLASGGDMPYNNIFNEPMSSFMDYVAVLKTTAPTAELTTLYNNLEQQTITIAAKRTPT